MPRTKQKFRRNQHRRGKLPQDKWDQDSGVRGNYETTVRNNDEFVKYYQAQKLMPAEEWDTFMEKLKEPLPSTFRIAGNKSQAAEMLKIIKGDYLNNLLDVEIEGRVIEPPKCLSWYPEEVAWQINLDRKIIRHSEVLKKFHQFMIQETESGNISRQEAVSMIPPLVLDIKPHHKVLDMCAAPGSKTAQLIEMLHADENIPIPDGFVMANDVDNKRCYLMVHQVRRLQSPSFIVVNHDASAIPSMKIMSKTTGKEVSMQFDRVLCDVPCSGDGTLRKNYDAWKKWNPAAGHSLHNLQTRILNRGLELLEVGGRLVYSTCSFNPCENESVIARMLLKCQGTVSLVDASDSLPGLIHEKGLTQWKIMTKAGDFYESHDEVPENLKTQIRPSVFPPTKEETETLNLHRCMRVLPHKQNTGGFFIAVLEKTAELPWIKFGTNWDGESVNAEESAEGKEENAADDQQPGDKRKEPLDPPQPKRRKPAPYAMRGYKEDPFVFLESDEAVWPGIRDFFDISPEFPVNQLMVRCKEGKKRNLYFASEIVRELITRNEDRFKFINLGLKVLNRSESKYVTCDYRIVQDGMSILFPFIRKRVVSVTKEDLIVVLSQENPYLTKLCVPTKEALEKLEQGGVVYLYEPDGRPDSPNCRIIICGWLGKVSCRSFLPKNERAHYLRLCGEELKCKDEVKTEKEADSNTKDPDQLDRDMIMDEGDEGKVEDVDGEKKVAGEGDADVKTADDAGSEEKNGGDEPSGSDTPNNATE